MAGFEPQGEDTSIRDSLAMRQLGTTISPKKIKRALKPYRLGDYKTKGKTDEQLYNVAQGAVIKWWQRQQKSKITSRDPGKTNTQAENRALNRMDTKVDKALDRIPDDPSAMALRRAEERAKQARNQLDDMIAGTGLRGVKPPAYAMTSVRNLQAWINRQIRLRNQLQEAREDYLR